MMALPGSSRGDDRENAPTTAVAIKVLHPHVEKIINRDLKIMGFFARILDKFPGMEWLSFPQEVDVFGGMMKSQLNLTHEANNLLRFEENFKHRTVVSFPRPLMDYTSQRVLVEEYEDAVPLKAFLREGGGPYDYRIASLGLDAFLVSRIQEDDHLTIC
jgi:aarF domain-containing kinase